mmetsp:Transcript_37490/g.117176  ORF Transcript_37490/g.117176 Transcript_37490/m.117176 type:complete len:225 (+) Transcript_37490:1781-2455(+)
MGLTVRCATREVRPKNSDTVPKLLPSSAPAPPGVPGAPDPALASRSASSRAWNCWMRARLRSSSQRSSFSPLRARRSSFATLKRRPEVMNARSTFAASLAPLGLSSAENGSQSLSSSLSMLSMQRSGDTLASDMPWATAVLSLSMLRSQARPIQLSTASRSVGSFSMVRTRPCRAALPFSATTRCCRSMRSSCCISPGRASSGSACDATRLLPLSRTKASRGML